MQKAMTESEIEAVLREVTDEEAAFYREYGWVMMKQLVTPEFAKELLRQGCHPQEAQESMQAKQPSQLQEGYSSCWWAKRKAALSDLLLYLLHVPSCALLASSAFALQD